MNIATIEMLAEQAKQMTSVGDAYADRRCSWVTDPANKDKAMWWGKEQPYYRFLYLVAKTHSGGMAIEVGTHCGIGFSCLAAGALASGNQHSWTVGIDKDDHGEAKEVSVQYPNCTFINGRSTDQNTVQRISDICQNRNVNINIMFIDATHTLSWVNAELHAYKHLFSDNVVLIFDDIIRADNNTALPECFEALPGQKIKFPGLHTDNCIAVSLTSREELSHWNPTIETRLEC